MAARWQDSQPANPRRSRRNKSRARTARSRSRSCRPRCRCCDLTEGENTLAISYRQPLAFTESGHSYFSAGKWRQSFTYELWPIAEWQWAPDFAADLQLKIAARDGFLGIGYKDDTIRCYIDEDGKFNEVDLSLSKPSAGMRSASSRVALKRAPQRLRCEYAAG
jgi:hypothetical protein